MSLEEFSSAVADAGHTYELERGVIVVDVPGVPHATMLQVIRHALAHYCIENAGKYMLITGGGESVIRLPGLQSERHPDISIYLAPPPTEEDQAWDVWLPDIVVEVVSKSSQQRDYEIKREEYLVAGVGEYWIINGPARNALVLGRRGDVWQERRLESADVLSSPRLPAFALPLSRVFAARKG